MKRGREGKWVGGEEREGVGEVKRGRKEGEWKHTHYQQFCNTITILALSL